MMAGHLNGHNHSVKTNPGDEVKTATPPSVSPVRASIIDDEIKCVACGAICSLSGTLEHAKECPFLMEIPE